MYFPGFPHGFSGYVTSPGLGPVPGDGRAGRGALPEESGPGPAGGLGPTRGPTPGRLAAPGRGPRARRWRSITVLTFASHAPGTQPGLGASASKEAGWRPVCRGHKIRHAPGRSKLSKLTSWASRLAPGNPRRRAGSGGDRGGVASKTARRGRSHAVAGPTRDDGTGPVLGLGLPEAEAVFDPAFSPARRRTGTPGSPPRRPHGGRTRWRSSASRSPCPA